MQAFSGCSKQGLLFVAVFGLLISVASLVAEQGSRQGDSVVVPHQLSTGSVVVAAPWHLESSF